MFFHVLQKTAGSRTISSPWCKAPAPQNTGAASLRWESPASLYAMRQVCSQACWRNIATQTHTHTLEENIDTLGLHLYKSRCKVFTAPYVLEPCVGPRCLVKTPLENRIPYRMTARCVFGAAAVFLRSQSARPVNVIEWGTGDGREGGRGGRVGLSRCSHGACGQNQPFLAQFCCQ